MVLNYTVFLYFNVISDHKDKNEEMEVVFTSKILIDINLVLSLVDMRVLER